MIYSPVTLPDANAPQIAIYHSVTQIWVRIQIWKYNAF